MTLQILRPLPELLNVNGDGENALVLARRAIWAGLDAEIVDRSDSRPDAIVIGSGFDGDLAEVAALLAPLREQLIDAAASGVPIIAIGTGMELLTTRIVLGSGEVIDGLGLLPGEVLPRDERVSGDVVVESRFGTLVGFENHARRYALPVDAQALGTVLQGDGNGTPERTEGVIAGSVLGSRIRGPLLAKNPALADHLLETMTKGAYRATSANATSADRLASIVRSQTLKRIASA